MECIVPVSPFTSSWPPLSLLLPLSILCALPSVYFLPSGRTPRHITSRFVSKERRIFKKLFGFSLYLSQRLSIHVWWDVISSVPSSSSFFALSLSHPPFLSVFLFFLYLFPCVFPHFFLFLYISLSPSFTLNSELQKWKWKSNSLGSSSFPLPGYLHSPPLSLPRSLSPPVSL